jgi:hypothetical protein
MANIRQSYMIIHLFFRECDAVRNVNHLLQTLKKFVPK